MDYATLRGIMVRGKEHGCTCLACGGPNGSDSSATSYNTIWKPCRRCHDRILQAEMECGSALLGIYYEKRRKPQPLQHVLDEGKATLDKYEYVFPPSGEFKEDIRHLKEEYLYYQLALAYCLIHREITQEEFDNGLDCILGEMVKYDQTMSIAEDKQREKEKAANAAAALLRNYK